MSSISFFCAVCGESLRAKKSFAGAIVECTRCERLVPVPGFPATTRMSGCTGVYPPGILAMDVTFLCGGCNAKLITDARWEGREFECPECKAMVKVPRWSGPQLVGTAGAELPTELVKKMPELSPEEIGFLNGTLTPSPS